MVNNNYYTFVIRKGFEPLAYSLEVNCSIQLSYRTIADCMGLEPMNSTVTGWHDNQLHQQSKLHYRSLTNFYFLVINLFSNLSNLESN